VTDTKHLSDAAEGDRGGPEESLADLLTSHLLEDIPIPDQARVEHIAAEASRAFERLKHVRKAVSIFGSAQIEPTHRWGEVGRDLARGLVEDGFSVITGGGPGLMEAASEGAHGQGSLSIGLTIDLPTQEAVNPYVELEVPFHYFFLRKLAFIKYSCAFVCLPGGFGTLDEMFEALNLVGTHKLQPFPILLFGSEYWEGLLSWLGTTAVGAGTLTEDRMALLEVVDDPAVVVARARECHRALCQSLGVDG